MGVDIIVSYNGREKRIPLSIEPSLELSDSDVDQAELKLWGIVRHLFSIPAEAAFSLHEVETNRTLTKESFRDPGYIGTFPRHWYITVEKIASEAGEEEEEDEDKQSYDPATIYSEGLDEIDETLPSLAELSLAEAKYQNIRLTADPTTGLFDVTLRYFSIQPTSSPMRVDSPTDVPSFGEGSLNSQQSVTSMDILSTIFVHHVERAGQEAGLRQGDTVHMINGESIIRSSYNELQDILALCGSDISLMVLPKEHDDLQFLYPQYTEGSVGEYTSGDERVIARDIPIVVGSGSSGDGGHRERSDRLSGEKLYHFNDGSGSSLDHTHSNSSNEQIPSGGDELINCSIHDIPLNSPHSRSTFTWYGTGSNSQLDRLDENEAYVTPSWKGDRPVVNGDMRYEYDREGLTPVDPSWYQDPPDNDVDPSSSQSGHIIKDHVTRCHSQDSGVLHRIVGIHSMSSDDGSHSQPMRAEDLGVVKISRRNKKSLEMLTSLSTTSQPRGMRRIHSDDVIGQSSQTNDRPEIRRHSEQNTVTTPTRKQSSSSSFTNRYQSSGDGSDTVTTHPPSGPSGGPTSGPSGRGSGPSTTRPRKTIKSYSSQRKELHKSRSRVDSEEAATRRAESLLKKLSQPVIGEETVNSEPSNDHTTILSPLHIMGGVGQSSPDDVISTPTIKVASEEESFVDRESEIIGRRKDERSHTLRHDNSSPPTSPRRYVSTTLDTRARPTLGPTVHTKQFTKSVEVPGTTSTRRLPIVKTRSAQTPYGTEVVRELNIDDAVAASQGTTNTLSVHHGSGRSYSIDASSSDGRMMMEGGRMVQSQQMRRHSLTHEERLSTASRDQVQCCGILNKKQISDGLGRRGGTRSWKQFYTVLVGSHMVFYRDKRDADANKPCEEPPIEVVPGRADLTHGYTKRRFVFRVMCGMEAGQGAEYLLQCDDSQSMLHWVTAIHRLNGGGRMVEQSAPKIDHSQLLTPGSPLSGRRESSPLPTGGSQRASSRKKGLVSGLKSALHRSKKGGTSQPSFKQLIADCPMSTDNKYVPVVVEMCVREVETNGLDIEGLYRKPGQASVIRSLVTDIDKGQFEFEEYGDIHTIGSLLKKFFQELQDALIPSDRYKEFLEVVTEAPGETEQVMRLRGLVFHLPIVHYHTLRYLIDHLNTVAEHSDKNKMVLRNVAMVFGPTLMLPSGATGELDLAAMNNTFTVIELLCKQWKNVFDFETCYEEQVLERERERERLKEAQKEKEGRLRHSQRTSSDPAVNNLKVKKDNALFNASPKMVRRIKNQFGSGQRRATDRNSYSGGEALMTSSSTRKQHNRSETLPPALDTSITSALLSPIHHVPSNKWGRAGSSDSLQPQGRGGGYGGGDLNPHSRYSSSGSHGDDGRREHGGSIWKKDNQRGAHNKKEGQSRSQLLSSHPPPPLIAHQHELLTSYQHPHTLPSYRQSNSSPSHEQLHRSTTLPASPEHHITHHQSNRGHHSMRLAASTQPPSSPTTRRKISYNLAVGEGSYQRQPAWSSQSGRERGYHRRRSSDQLPYVEENEFSRSYTPQSNTSQSTNHSSGKSGSHSTSHQSGSRYQSHAPQRGDTVQRSRHNESYH